MEITRKPTRVAVGQYYQNLVVRLGILIAQRRAAQLAEKSTAEYDAIIDQYTELIDDYEITFGVNKQPSAAITTTDKQSPSEV